MEKGVFSILLFILLISFVIADDWDSLVDENPEEPSSKQNDENPTEVYTPYTEQTTPSINKDSSKGETKFTQDFYIALILLIVIILIIAYFAYSFFKKPKNKWEK